MESHAEMFAKAAGELHAHLADVGEGVRLDTIFAAAPRPDHLKLPDSRAGALSCLTGIAARKSCEEKRPWRSRSW